MTDTKFYASTKSRLNRLGYKGFSKEDYLKVADSIGVADLNNPSPEELSQAVQFLSQQRDKANSVLMPSNSELGEIVVTEPKVISVPEISDEQVTPEEQLTSTDTHPTESKLATATNEPTSLSKAEANELSS